MRTTPHELLRRKGPPYDDLAPRRSKMERRGAGRFHDRAPAPDQPADGPVGLAAAANLIVRDDGLPAPKGTAFVLLAAIVTVTSAITASLYQGRITREFTAEEVNEDNLVQAISGIGVNGSARPA